MGSITYAKLNNPVVEDSSPTIIPGRGESRTLVVGFAPRLTDLSIPWLTVRIEQSSPVDAIHYPLGFSLLHHLTGHYVDSALTAS